MLFVQGRHRAATRRRVWPWIVVSRFSAMSSITAAKHASWPNPASMSATLDDLGSTVAALVRDVSRASRFESDIDELSRTAATFAMKIVAAQRLATITTAAGSDSHTRELAIVIIETLWCQTVVGGEGCFHYCCCVRCCKGDTLVSLLCVSQRRHQIY